MNFRSFFGLLSLIIIFSCSSDSPTDEDVDTIEAPVDLGTRIVSVEVPDNFIGARQSFYVLLSDAEGNFIDGKEYSNTSETIDFYTKNEFDDSTLFTITFISSFNDQSFNLNVYSDLTRSMLGDKIVFKPRGNSLSGGSVELNVPFYDNGYVLSATGQGYSARLIDNKLSGFFTNSFNENLGSEKAFIKYYDPGDVLNGPYQWAFVEDLNTLSELNISDFTTEDVAVKQLSTNRPGELPLLLLYGFDNENLYESIASHILYGNYIPAFGFGGNHYYSFADIFDHMVYSIEFTVSKYTVFGVGIPPSEINVPEISIDSDFKDEKLTFSGIPDFEVGRIRLNNSNNSIQIDFVFDGQSTAINIPNIPSGVLPDNIARTINEKQLSLTQALAENYSSFDNYDDYISDVFISSTPFYINSDRRERVFKSFVGPSILPVFEFPYFQAFR
ncbi:hypothetical protein GTQ40_00030 [Flavobacteriaceae bacterium R38]|nr:hypothetical protein [Flavobacteriaceae bacterium R38]